MFLKRNVRKRPIKRRIAECLYKDITVTKVVYGTYEFPVGVLRIESNFLQKKLVLTTPLAR